MKSFWFALFSNGRKILLYNSAVVIDAGGEILELTERFHVPQIPLGKSDIIFPQVTMVSCF